MLLLRWAIYFVVDVCIPKNSLFIGQIEEQLEEKYPPFFKETSVVSIEQIRGIRIQGVVSKFDPLQHSPILANPEIGAWEYILSLVGHNFPLAPSLGQVDKI